MGAEPAPISMWGAVPHDAKRMIERLARSDDVKRVAVMPDVHLADEVCVGVAVATSTLLYPDAVGGDIGCGMMSVKLAVDVERIRALDDDTAGAIFAGLDRRVPVMWQCDAQPLPAILREGAHDPRTAARQLGTLGRGNHFLELQRATDDDDDGDVWLTVHSGSRGMGQAIKAHHVKHAQRSRVGLAVLDAETAAGAAYLADVQWALAFAEENRRVIIGAALDVLGDVVGARIDEHCAPIACHHNHVERVGELWVHRKGANPAHEGALGIIPGSMAADTFHVAGRGVAEALWSSSHGAGRAISRGEAHAKIGVARFLDEVDQRSVIIDRGRARSLVDEAPSAYKDIGRVMRAQKELVRIVRRLQPILSFKGG